MSTEVHINYADTDRYVDIDGRGFVMTPDGYAEFKSLLASAPEIAWVMVGGIEIRVTPATKIAVTPYVGDGMVAMAFDLRDAERPTFLVG